MRDGSVDLTPAQNPVAADFFHSNLAVTNALAHSEQQQQSPISNFTNPTTRNNAVIAHSEETTTIHAEAMAVVDAEIADSQIELLRPSKRNGLCWLWIALLVTVLAVAVGVGAYCGTGKCGGSPSTTSLTPVVAPFGVPSTSLPPMSIFEQQLTVACTFLDSPNISECQNMSSFTGKSVGTTIPLEIGVLTQLIFLNLYGNRLIGTIPSSLGNLTKLTELDLLMNSLTGTIPSLLGNLTQLSSLGLSFNQLNGTVPSIVGNLIKLTSLFLGDNQLTGSIPSTFLNLVQLRVLALNNNPQLTVTIPSTLCNSELSILIDCDTVACTCCTDIDGQSCPNP